MDVILHVGAHRTGTTTLQEYLRRNRPALIGTGLLPVLPAETRGPLFDGLIQRPADAIGPARRKAREARGRVMAELDRAERAGLRQVLISDENFAGAPRIILRDGAIYADLDDRMRWLGPDLRDRVTRVGFAVRRYDDWWASVLAYGVASGLHVPDAGDAARLSLLPRRWPDVVQTLAACFARARIVVWPFEALAAQPARQMRLLRGNGVTLPPDGGAAPRNNASPDAAALRAVLTAAGQGAAQLLPARGRWMPFGEAERAAMAAAYAADLVQLARMPGGRIRLAGRAETSIPAAAQPAPAPSQEGRQHGRYRYMA